jgi:hypothetical protein
VSGSHKSMITLLTGVFAASPYSRQMICSALPFLSRSLQSRDLHNYLGRMHLRRLSEAAEARKCLS